MIAINDLQRVHSRAFDDVVRYCRSLYKLPIEGEKSVDVSVTRREREHCTTDQGHKLPISYESGLVYVMERKGATSVRRNETVADLCADPMEREVEPDNPGLRTSCPTVITEAKLQVLARLQKLLQLKDEGIVGKLTYSQTAGESADVTMELLAEFAGGSAIPSEFYRILDDFTVNPTGKSAMLL